MSRVTRVIRRIGRRVAADVLAWSVAIPLAMFLRSDLSFSRVHWGRAMGAVLVVAVFQAWAQVTTVVRYGRRNAGTFADAQAIALTTSVATVALFVLNLTLWSRALAPSVPLVAGFIALFTQMSARATYRTVNEGRKRPNRATAKPVLIFGGGEAGTQIITGMLRDKHSGLYPVAVLDDDPGKFDLRVHGVPVVGDRRDIAGAAAHYGATGLVIAVRSAPSELIRELSALGAAAGLTVRVVPELRDLVDGNVHVEDLRPVTEQDLLGRREIDTDVASIASYITGRRVLVTGAGGSIGAELCRRVSRFNPETLVMLDRDESALHAVQLSIDGFPTLDDPNLVVADIRDAARMQEVFQRHLPDVVFHAAALKHLSLLEMHPSEAVKTNIFGTQNVLDAAQAVGVKTLVNISTDKAANPQSVLGYTKRLAERLTAAVDLPGSTFLSVRFGNVLGSRGSVLTVFRHQIAEGRNVTVTDPEVTRFFMTIEEAVQLVIQAGAIGNPSEALVLDMGEPVRIAEVAARLIEASGRDLKIEYTGLRHGEKVHEELIGNGELDARPSHHLISQVPVPALPIEYILAAGPDADSIANRLTALCSLAVPAKVVDVRTTAGKPGDRWSVAG